MQSTLLTQQDISAAWQHTWKADRRTRVGRWPRASPRVRAGTQENTSCSKYARHLNSSNSGNCLRNPQLTFLTCVVPSASIFRILLKGKKLGKQHSLLKTSIRKEEEKHTSIFKTSFIIGILDNSKLSLELLMWCNYPGNSPPPLPSQIKFPSDQTTPA